MEILHIYSLPESRKKCEITVTEEQFEIRGEFDYLVNKEFRHAQNVSDTCPVGEYLGLGELHKRSPKKTIQFIVAAFVLETVQTIAGKIADTFSMFDTGWTDHFIHFAVILCLIAGAAALFSKRNVTEISFLTKRFCVDETVFAKQDVQKLNQILKKLKG